MALKDYRTHPSLKVCSDVWANIDIEVDPESREGMPLGVNWEYSPLFDIVSHPWLMQPSLNRLLTVNWCVTRLLNLRQPDLGTKKVFDYGASYGEHKHLFGKERFGKNTRLQYFAADIDPDKKKVAEQIYPRGIPYEIMNVDQIQETAHQPYDAIIFSEVLEHLDPETEAPVVPQAFWDILSPDGYVVLTAATESYRRKNQNPWHLKHWSVEEIAQLFNKYFSVIDSFHLLVYFAPLSKENQWIPFCVKNPGIASITDKEGGTAVVLLQKREYPNT